MRPSRIGEESEGSEITKYPGKVFFGDVVIVKGKEVSLFEVLAVTIGSCPFANGCCVECGTANPARGGFVVGLGDLRHEGFAERGKAAAPSLEDSRVVPAADRAF